MAGPQQGPYRNSGQCSGGSMPSADAMHAGAGTRAGWECAFPSTGTSDGTKAWRLLRCQLTVPRAFNHVLSLAVHLSIGAAELAEQLADQFCRQRHSPAACGTITCCLLPSSRMGPGSRMGGLCLLYHQMVPDPPVPVAPPPPHHRPPEVHLCLEGATKR
ncbi:hypothetical protein HPB52_005779 [Rhipicephalus sanguineus]|uniref:Uncharacterized protein n=1 Tax=Rhipicephalus sanguineus TaxID=34632 RepID=A0A9D4PX70_RHISA|nr:hypothetical protein HPB52_005779 [Rhipicephalus sanguineus]